MPRCNREEESGIPVKRRGCRLHPVSESRNAGVRAKFQRAKEFPRSLYPKVGFARSDAVVGAKNISVKSIRPIRSWRDYQFVSVHAIVPPLQRWPRTLGRSSVPSWRRKHLAGSRGDPYKPDRPQRPFYRVPAMTLVSVTTRSRSWSWALRGAFSTICRSKASPIRAAAGIRARKRS